MGMKPCQDLENGFNMGILALKVAGKKKRSKQITRSSIKRTICRCMARNSSK